MLNNIIFFLVFSLGYTSSIFSQEEIGYYRSLDTIDKAFVVLNGKLKSELHSKNPFAIANARLELGIFCQENGVYAEAINQFNKGVLLLGGKNHDTLYLNLIDNLGEVHLNLKDYNTAKNYFEKGIVAATKLNSSSYLASLKSNLGVCFEKKKNYAEALKLQQESLGLYTVLEDAEGLSRVNENIGSIYEDLEKFTTALHYFKKSLHHHTGEFDARLANILNNLGDVNRKTGVLDQGLYYTNKSLTVAKAIRNKKEEASAYKDLAENYQLLEDLDKAYANLNRFLEVDKENRKLENSNQARALQVIYATKEKETQIQALLQNSKVDNAQKTLLVGLILVFLIFMILWYVYFQKKRKNSQKEALLKQQLLKVKLDKIQSDELSLQTEVRLKNTSLSRYSLHLSQKNKMLSNLSHTLKNCLDRSNVDLKRKLMGLIKEIDFNLSQEDEWDEFMILFQEIHPEYIQKINKLVTGSLSPSELRLSILLRLNLSSKEIASILRLTPDSVRVSRYRLRKKLPIDSKQELSAFLHSF
ncbi:tetratricopeptide repeat protein [Cellulophaga sp. Z1A5H]|uniref:tetratricopeptide repeat protein n=1 Tax=Cellulophaga sp. Z1A5H TaxID=2687291 RepID=UPI0013FE3DDC|nr:tetratricopeptide repeat protein [Cellulophaga sp. Z1A5H]